MKKLALSTFVVFSSIANAQAPFHPPIHTPGGNGPSKVFSVDDQIYELTVAGIEKYTESVRENSELYSKLQPELKKLTFKQNLALGVGVAGGVTGAYFFYQGLQPVDIDSSNFDDEAEKRYDEETKDRETSLRIGLIAFATGTVGYYLIKPDQEDLLDFINLNNRIGKNKMNISFKLMPNGLMAAVTF